MTFLFIALGILPSVVWLSVYLREDDRPEPNFLILRVFFAGALSAPVAAGVELLGLNYLLPLLSLPPLLVNLVSFFLVVALTEEAVKYWAVRTSVRYDRNFDEPTDAMIYLIVAALGFAAVENVLAVFGFAQFATEALEVTLLRFVSATLLHVLASAVVGYYLAREHFFLKGKKVFKGIALAAFAHGIYNILTLASSGFQNLPITLTIVVLLGLLAVTVNILFYKLKKDFFQ